MKHYKTIDELKADLNDYKDLIVPEHDVKVDFDIPLGVLRNIECRNFTGRNFTSRDFNGWDFNGWNFTGGNFTGGNFTGWNFTGWDFNGWDFNGRNFTGRDFNGGNFTGGNFTGMDFNGDHIDYYALFVCYDSCSCLSHKSRRNNALPIQCLDGELIIREESEEG